MLIQPMTNQNKYKVPVTIFKGGSIVPKPILETGDSFIKSVEQPVLCTIKDIANYLKQHVDKIGTGRIFNTPITKEGDSLLMAFFHITPIKEEMEEYENIIYKMSKLPEINYNQTDSSGISALEWVIMSESTDKLALIKGKDLTYDSMIFNAYKNIKDPQFKKELLSSGLFVPPSIETKEEQKIIVESIISKKHSGIPDSVIDSIIKSLCNNENNISGEMIVLFKKIINLSSVREMEKLPEAISLLKDEKGNVNSEKATYFLAVYEEKNNSIQSALDSVRNKYYPSKTVQVDTNVEKKENEIVERFQYYVETNGRNPSIQGFRTMDNMLEMYREILERRCPEYIGFYNNQAELEGYSSSNRRKNSCESPHDLILSLINMLHHP